MNAKLERTSTKRQLGFVKLLHNFACIHKSLGVLLLLCQILYDIGDEADRFYIILTGSCEVWTHPPSNLR